MGNETTIFLLKRIMSKLLYLQSLTSNRSVISFLEQILMNTIITTNWLIVTANERRDWVSLSRFIFEHFSFYDKFWFQRKQFDFIYASKEVTGHHKNDTIVHTKGTEARAPRGTFGRRGRRAGREAPP